MEIEEYELEPQPRELLKSGSNEDIYLSVKIGNGQIGGNVVQSEDDTVVAKGDFTEPVYLGNTNILKGKILKVTTNILDVNSATNNCVLTTTFQSELQEVLFTKIDSGEAPLNGVASFIGTYLIKTLIVFFGLSIFFIQSAVSQSNNEVELKDLATPTSPGFILFDETPSSIETPSSPKALGISLLGLKNSGGALEFAPYWLKNRSKLTAENIYKKNGNYNTIKSNLGFSLTAIDNDSIAKIALGVRTRFIEKYSKDDIGKLDSLRLDIITLLSTLPMDLEAIEKKRKEYTEKLASPAFSLDFAAALGGESQTNSFQNLQLNRWAVWLSGNIRLKAKNLYLTGLTRYINSEIQDGQEFEADLIDIGLKLNKEINRITIAIEYLQRMNLTDNDFSDNRIAAIGSFKVSDGIYLTSTIGKNFSDTDNIILLGGLNFGFSQKKIKMNQPNE
ncbi:hypothetical protein [Maribacter sp. R77961]|uniref:hypothetical protein n=1 Tax=Maribacter sp. R77961 TaxID=3093871 RepID=UPI0037CC3262